MHIAREGRTVIIKADEPALECAGGWIGLSFHYWRGGSGLRYLHTVYPLIGCPALPRANYVLVRREADGRCTPLGIGQTRADAASLNLAHLRHEGAKRGANEIHVHLLTKSADGRAAVQRDLERGQHRRISAGIAPAAQSVAA